MIMGAVHSFLQGARHDQRRDPFVPRSVCATPGSIRTWRRSAPATPTTASVVSPTSSTIKGQGPRWRSCTTTSPVPWLILVNHRRRHHHQRGRSGPRSVILWTVKSTTPASIFGMPGSGKRIERTIAHFLMFRDGSDCEGAAHLRFHQHADAVGRVEGEAELNGKGSGPESGIRSQGSGRWLGSDTTSAAWEGRPKADRLRA